MIYIDTGSEEMTRDDEGNFTGDEDLITLARQFLSEYGPHRGDPYKYLHNQFLQIYPDAYITSTFAKTDDDENVLY